MKRLITVLFLIVFISPVVRADEGMWLLTKAMLGDKYKDMKKEGLKLKPSDIYDINNSSLKDAVCTLNHGSCTGEMISSQGLMLTNHHCGYGAIQEFSSEEHDYLTDGFWAMSHDKELYVEGMTVTFLVEIRNVTDQILEGLTAEASEADRIQTVRGNRAKIIAEAIKDTHYEAEVKEFYDGNEYYLFINVTYRDVRLVGAPPSSIGKFGGDTDNWEWPRHTGDFSMFRIYCGADGKPADHSASNVPFKPKKHLTINIGGVKPNDYAMVMGYPGSTDRFLTSFGVKLAVEKDQPARVKIRAKKLEIMRNDMAKSDKVRIQYASKYAQVSNYWKYFIGQSEQLVNNNVYDKKKKIEDDFQAWANADASRKEIYGNVINSFKEGYETKNKYWYVSTYLNEAVFGPEINLFLWTAVRPYKEALKDGDEEGIAKAKEALLEKARSLFKDLNIPTEQKIYATMMQMYQKDVPVDLQPESLDSLSQAYGGFDEFASQYYANSQFTSLKRIESSIDSWTVESIEEDAAFGLLMDFINSYRETSAMTQMADLNLNKAKRLFVDGLMQMNPDKVYSPNANSTLRLSYGSIGGYSGKDAINYSYYTTLEGIMEKEDPNNDEFIVPAKLKTLYQNKDYGRYAQDGQLRVNFISDNDITGGNSGSPVMNAKGELIGTAFDGNWEAMSGDIFFEPDLQRTISVDIRYTLFIIDKYAGATHHINEMTIVD